MNVFDFSENEHYYIAVMHMSTINQNSVYFQDSLLMKHGSNYKEIWKKDLYSEISADQLAVEDIDGDGYKEVIYVSMTYGSHTGSGTIGAYTVANKQDYSISVGTYGVDWKSDNLKNYAKIVDYLTNSDAVAEIISKLNSTYNNGVNQSSGQLSRDNTISKDNSSSNISTNQTNENSKVKNEYENCDLWDGYKWVTLTYKQKNSFVSGYLLCTKFNQESKIMDNINVVVEEVDNYYKNNSKSETAIFVIYKMAVKLELH